MPGPLRRAVTCKMCGQQFFPASMKFHVKECAKKQARKPLPCPYCDAEFMKPDLQKHMKSCASRPRGGNHQTHSASAAPAHSITLSAMDTTDGRAPCSICGRKFNIDRLAKHQSICRKITKNAAKRGTFNAAKQRVEEEESSSRGGRKPQRQRRGAKRGKRGSQGRPSLRARMASQSTAGSGASSVMVSPIKGPAPSRGGGGGDKKWQQQSSALRDAMKRNREVAKAEKDGTYLGPTMPSADQHKGLVPCPHCGRTFNPQAAGRHIPKCANIINKPKAPPTMSPMKPVGSRKARPGGRPGGRAPRSADQRGISPDLIAQRNLRGGRKLVAGTQRGKQLEQGWNDTTSTSGSSAVFRGSGRPRAKSAVGKRGAAAGAWVAPAFSPYVGALIGKTMRAAKGVREITGTRRRSGRAKRVKSAAPRRARSRGAGGAVPLVAGSSYGGGRPASRGALRATQATSRDNPLATSQYQVMDHERRLDPRLSVTRQARPGAVRATQATSADNPLATSTYQVMSHERPLDPRLSVTRQARPGAVRATQATSSDNPLATSGYQTMSHERPLDPRLSVTRQHRPGATRATQATSSDNPLATSTYQTMSHEQPLDPRLSVTRQHRPGAVRATQATSSDNPLATSGYQTMSHEQPLDPRLSVTRQRRPGATRSTNADSADNPMVTSSYMTADHGKF